MLSFPSNVRHVQELICQTAMDNHSTLKHSFSSSSISESHSSTSTLQINNWDLFGERCGKTGSQNISLNEVDIVYVFCSWLNSHSTYKLLGSYVLLVIQFSVGIFLSSVLDRTSFELKDLHSEIVAILFSTIWWWHCFCKFIMCYLNHSVKNTTYPIAELEVQCSF